MVTNLVNHLYCAHNEEVGAAFLEVPQLGLVLLDLLLVLVMVLDF
jgi:hypothetical protein